MLDHRASAVSASARLSTHGQAARIAGGLDARQANADDISFGSFFSEAFSDKRPVKAQRPDRPAAAAEQARPESTSSRKQAQRKKSAAQADADQHARADDVSAQDRQAAPSMVEPPADRSISQGPVADAEPQVPPSDAAEEPAVRPDDSAANAAAATPQPVQSGDAATIADAAQQAASATLVEGGTADVSGQEDAQPDSAAAPTASRKMAKGGDVAMQPLQWLARQQAARLNAEAASAEATASADSAAEPLQALAQTQAGNQPAHGETAGKARANGLFAKVLGGESSKNGAAAGTQPNAKASAEEVVRSLSADATSLLPDGGKSLEPRTQTAGSSATQPHAGDKGLVTISAEGVPAGQIVDSGQAAIQPHAVAAYGPAGKDAVLTHTPNGADTARNADHLARIVYAAAGRGQSVARMNLKPPELGDVTATLRLAQGRMELKLEVASEAARDVVAGGMDRLRENLQHHGISLDTTSVTVAPKAESSAGREHQQGQPGQDAQHQPAPQEQGSGHGQPQQDRSAANAPDVAFAASPAGGADDEMSAAVSYTVSLNVVA